MLLYQQYRIFQLILFNCLLIGQDLAEINRIINIVEQTAEMMDNNKQMECKKMAIAKQIVEIHQKANGNIENELLDVCQLLNCANTNNIDGCLKKALIMNCLHPDKVEAENATLAREAFQVIDSLRNYIAEKENKDIFFAQEISGRSQKSPRQTPGFIHNGKMIKMNNLKHIRKMRLHLMDENVFQIFDAIEIFVAEKNRSLKLKFYHMEDEIIFHRKIFFNKKFEQFLEDIEKFGNENYDARVDKIDELIVMICKKMSSEVDWSQFKYLTKNYFEDIVQYKMQQIVKWKENAYKAKSEMDERLELEEKANQIRMKRAELREHSPSSSFLNLASLNLALALSPMSKAGIKLKQLKHQLEELQEEIDKKCADEFHLINAPSNRPTAVYKKWKHWENLPFTKAFFNAIENMYLFNMSDEKTINMNNKLFYGPVKSKSKKQKSNLFPKNHH